MSTATYANRGSRQLFEQRQQNSQSHERMLPTRVGHAPLLASGEDRQPLATARTVAALGRITGAAVAKRSGVSTARMATRQIRQSEPLLLLIEDHRDTLVAAGRLLEASGFAVEIAKGGEPGIEKARDSKPDVVVTDMVMPGTTGCDVCEELHRDTATRDTPIIACTGLTDAKALASVVRFGVRVFAIKLCLATVLAREARTLLIRESDAAGVRVVTGEGEELADFAKDVEARSSSRAR